MEWRHQNESEINQLDKEMKNLVDLMKICSKELFFHPKI